MNKQSEQVWTVLRENGIVQGDQPPQKTLQSPWYVKLLLIFSAWLTAVFIFFFCIIFRIGGIRWIVTDLMIINELYLNVTGVIMIIVSFILLRVPVNTFFEHLGLAISMAGQALITYTMLISFHDSVIVFWGILTIFHCVLYMIMPNYIHQFISSFAAAMSLSRLLTLTGLPSLGILMFGMSFCWINEFSYPQHIKRMQSTGYGMSFALIVIEYITAIKGRYFGIPLFHNFYSHPWLEKSLIAAAVLYVSLSILRRYGQTIQQRVSIITLLGTLFIYAVSVEIRGLTASMIIICLGFFSANRFLLGFGIFSILFSISSYYYFLDTNLLIKSISLFVAGLILLFIRWILPHTLPVHNEEENA